MTVWTNLSPAGVHRQVAINILITHVFSGLTLWDFIISLPSDWSVMRGHRGCGWGMAIFYANCRYLAFCSTWGTLIFVDLLSSKFVRELGTFFQISALIATGFAYGILALRIMTICRHDALTLLMVLCQMAMWAATFATFPHVIDGWQDRRTHLWLTNILLVFSTTMLLCGFCGLIVSFRSYLRQTARSKRSPYAEARRPPHTLMQYALMLWQERLQYFAIAWLVQIAEATVRYIDIDKTKLLQFTVSYVGFSVTTMFACRVYRDMTIHCEECPFDEYRIFWRSWIRPYICLAGRRSSSPEHPMVTQATSPGYQFPQYRWKARAGNDGGMPKVNPPAISIVLNPLSRDKMKTPQECQRDVQSVLTPCSSTSEGVILHKASLHVPDRR